MQVILKFGLLAVTAMLLLACSPEEPQRQILHSDMSEGAWLATCASPSSLDLPECFDRRVMWVLTLQEQTTPGHLIATLGPRNNGLRVEITLADMTLSLEEDIANRTFFVAGLASLELSSGRRPLARLEEGELLGFQTLVQGPKQGVLAPDLTLAEFGRYCLLAPQETYTDQCAGKRVLWYGLLRGAAPDGVILGLPFDNASIARVKTSDPLIWPIGDTSALRDTPIVIEGVLEAAMAHRDNGNPVPVIIDAHIISFSQRTEPLAEITGVE